MSRCDVCLEDKDDGVTCADCLDDSESATVAALRAENARLRGALAGLRGWTIRASDNEVIDAALAPATDAKGGES